MAISIKYKLTFLAFVASILTSAVSDYSSYKSNLALIESAKNQELRLVATLIQTDFANEFSHDAARASLIANMPPVVQAFRRQDRQELLRLVAPGMDAQRKRFEVWDAEFDLPPATAFLRPFNPTQFGDDISLSSEMVLQTNKKGEPQQGMEIVGSGIGMRGSAVVKDSMGRIGSFVMAIDIELTLDNVQKATGFKVAVLINNLLWSRTVISKKAINEDAKVIGGLLQVLISGSVRGKKRDFSKVDPVLSSTLLSQFTNITYRTETVKGVDYGYVVIPLLDFKGEEIGAIVAVKNFDNYKKQIRYIIEKTVIYSLIQSVLLAAFVYFVISVIFISPINKTIDRLSKLVSGTGDSPESRIKKEDLTEIAKGLKDRLRRRNASVLMLGFIVILSAIASFFRFIDGRKIIQDAERRELNTIISQINTYIEHQINQAAALTSLVANFPPVQEAFQKQDRKQLFDLLDPSLKIQLEKYGVTEAIFFNPPAIAFLRMYHSGHFGDDVASFDELVVKGNAEHKPEQGIQACRKGLCIQAVEPIVNNNEFVGSFQLSTDFSRILNYVKDTSDFDVGVYVEKELFLRVATEYGKIEDERMVNGYVNERSSDWKKIKPFSNDKTIFRSEETKYRLMSMKNVDYGVITIPLFDQSKKNIGLLLVVGDFKLYQKLLLVNLVHCFAYMSTQIFLIAGLILIIFRAVFVRPIGYLNEVLIQLGEGKAVEEVKYVNRKDLVGILAGYIEQARNKTGSK